MIVLGAMILLNDGEDWTVSTLYRTDPARVVSAGGVVFGLVSLAGAAFFRCFRFLFFFLFLLFEFFEFYLVEFE